MLVFVISNYLEERTKTESRPNEETDLIKTASPTVPSITIRDKIIRTAEILTENSQVVKEKK